LSPCLSTKKINWTNLTFFSAVTAIAVIGLPLYWTRFGISQAEWALFAFYVFATGFSITVGYHRLFAHRSFKASGLVTFLNLMFGAAAFEQSALMWASQHRDHHRFVDTPLDPYSIKKGFWYAHIGWILFWTQKTDYSNVRDLESEPLIAHQHRYYLLWAIASGILLPLLIGAATGHLLGALVLSVAARLTFVHHSTFCINSVCHTFGRATYDIDSTARDHWLVALITNGEGYHNFHHRFPSDYRNGIRWYHWDPSKWAIALMTRVGLTYHPYRTSEQTIIAARLAAEELRVERALAKGTAADANALLSRVKDHYARAKNALYEWEWKERELRRTSLNTLRSAVEEKRRGFELARRQWAELINCSPLIPSKLRVSV
jgi:stearoyl-CoA desaturase (Delta-9 desaturase)